MYRLISAVLFEENFKKYKTNCPIIIKYEKSIMLPNYPLYQKNIDRLQI